MSNCTKSNYLYYTAYYDKKCIGNHRVNLAYNTLLELAELVSKKIYKLYKPKKFTFDLVDVQQNITYRYLVDMTYYTFMSYGDYRIGHDKDKQGCDTYHPDIMLPVLINTLYPDVVVPKTPFWNGEKIDGLFRDDVFNYIHGKWYGN